MTLVLWDEKYREIDPDDPDKEGNESDGDYNSSSEEDDVRQKYI